MTIRNSRWRIARRAVGPTALALALLLSARPSEAAEEPPAAPRWDFRGYGTIGIVHSSERQADFLGGMFIRTGPGQSRSWSPELDSRLGAQLTATLTPRFSAVVQVVAEQAFDGSYAPHLEWANVKYQITPDASVRLGRIVIPSFLLSDSRKVGYANPWVRPPAEVYGLVPVTSNDGIDASYRLHLGDSTTTTFQASYGETELDLPVGSRVLARSAMGVSVAMERGGATVRATYRQADLTIDAFDDLFAGLRQFGPEGVALADRYAVDGTRFDFIGVGALYDASDWFAMAEWGTSNTHAVIGDRTAWYASAGYRFGKVTPYVSYAQTVADSSRSDPGLTVAAYPPHLFAAASGLNAALNGVLAMVPVQETVSIGARWDVGNQVDFKIQLDHSDVGAGSAGMLGNTLPGFEPGGSYNLLSVAVDFVF